MDKGYLDLMAHYAALGYDVTITRIYFKDGIRMTYRHYDENLCGIECQQITRPHDEYDLDYFRQVLNFMYDNINQQVEAKG